jgi:hypothetical protein
MHLSKSYSRILLNGCLRLLGRSVQFESVLVKAEVGSQGHDAAREVGIVKEVYVQCTTDPHAFINKILLGLIGHEMVSLHRRSHSN